MFVLKNYQEESLRILGDYLNEARLSGAAEAFENIIKKNRTPFDYPFQPLSEKLAAVPYACLRIPTGGGKTLLATYAIEKAAAQYMDTETPLVLWVVPTSVIKQQTLSALRTPGHPYRNALEELFDNRFRVFDISEFTQIRPQDLKSKANIVLATFASYRVKNDNEEIRKVYAYHEDLEDHFKHVRPDSGLEINTDGNVSASFINLLNMHRPLVIVDEAHNNRSELSIDRLEKINPSCVIEFTATPAKDSNILHHVSASELKAEEMIKLPIELTEHDSWQEAIHTSVLERARLHELAQNEPDYIRPILLIQAQKKNEDITVDQIEHFLTVEEGIDRRRIAIATGNQRELEGIDLLDKKTEIEFVITIDALKEGWDCSFAYILCSVANRKSSKDVEQLLGRVLRMPYAKTRHQLELNSAYAHVSSPSWKNAVAQIHDNLVSMGFDEAEAMQNIYQRSRPSQQDFSLEQDSELELPVCRFSTGEKVNLEALAPEERGKIELTPLCDGKTNISFTGVLSQEAENVLAKQFTGKEKTYFKTTMAHRRAQAAQRKSFAAQKIPFEVPQLCLEIDGHIDLAERDFYMQHGFRLSDFSAELPGFEIKDENSHATIDIHNGRVVEVLAAHEQGELYHTAADDVWSEDQLVNWLDRRLANPHVQPSDMRNYIRATLKHLKERGISFAQQQTFIFPLQKAFEGRIRQCFKEACKNAYQLALFSADSTAKTDEQFTYRFSFCNYPAQWFYSGSVQFPKHYFSQVGELKSKGEEFECAKAIEQNNDVEFWIRNLDRKEACAFRLPVATGYFYPDFVAKLKDDRILVVEYKGEHLEDKSSEKEKLEIGKLWEQKSNGKGLFLFAVKRDGAGRDVAAQIQEKIC
jgi:type III restriction enzyme